jgi:hypothetical protein
MITHLNQNMLKALLKIAKKIFAALISIKKETILSKKICS